MGAPSLISLTHSVLFTDNSIHPPTSPSHLPFHHIPFLPVPRPVRLGLSSSSFILNCSHQAPSVPRPALPNPASVLLCVWLWLAWGTGWRYGNTALWVEFKLLIVLLTLAQYQLNRNLTSTCTRWKIVFTALQFKNGDLISKIHAVCVNKSNFKCPHFLLISSEKDYHFHFNIMIALLAVRNA